MPDFRTLFKKKTPTAAAPSAKSLTLRQVLSVTNRGGLPSWKQWMQLPQVLLPKERRLMKGALALLVLSVFLTIGWYVATHREEIPAVGGEYVEALIGEPQFINPLYANASDVDADLSRLVFSGLMKWDPDNGLVPDLANDVQISEDGKTYTMRIRDNARFHNGDAVRAADVIFTIDAIQNPQYHSPLAVSFRGVTVSQVDDTTVAFHLEEPFAPFLSTLTVGILPANVWADVSPRNATLASRNLEPIGSGPYKFSKFSKDKKGSILSYTLERNPDYYGASPKIARLVFKFYADAADAVQALANRNVEGVSFIPSDLEEEVEKNRSVTLLRPTLPRETILFFNQEKQAIFKKAEVRKAIAAAINKQAIIDESLRGHGTAIDAPLLSGMVGFHPEVAKITYDPAAAAQLLTDAGYPLPEDGTPTRAGLAFTLTTVQSPEFVDVAGRIAEQLAAVGIQITVSTVSTEEFYSAILEPRAYELLLTGELLGTDSDLYPFWHSSQSRGGLNLANYANRKADTLLEEARSSINAEERATKYREFQDLVVTDIPAVFLYQSTYAYAVGNKVKNVELTRIATPADRFFHIADWYVKTKQVLK